MPHRSPSSGVNNDPKPDDVDPEALVYDHAAINYSWVEDDVLRSAGDDCLMSL